MGAGRGLDIRQIAERLPHRYPMLLVDRVVEVHGGEGLVAIKNVTSNEDFFRGHFPGNPVMPGVLIIEAMAQSAGLLISLAAPEPGRLTSYLVGVDEAKFRRPVVPGDRLRIEVRLLLRRSRYWRFRTVASVEDDRVAQAELLLAVLAEGERAP